MIKTINDLIEYNIENNLEHLNSNIYVIVPEQFSFEFDKKLYEIVDHPENFSSENTYSQSLYSNLGAYKYNHINVTKFSKLAEQIITLYGKSSKDYINELSKIIAMHQAIRNIRSRDEFTILKRQSKSVEFIDLALREIAELKKSNISVETLKEKSKNFPKRVREKALDMARIYDEYDSILKSKNLQDSLSDILECDRLVKENNCFKDAILFIDEFDAFTNDELQLLDTIFSQCKDFYITLRTNGKFNRNSTQFETVDKTYNQLLFLANKHNQGVKETICETPYRYQSKDGDHFNDLITISQNILTNSKMDSVTCNGDVTIMECTDYYQECDYVCSQIRKLIIDEGYSYNDIFVTARHIDDYLGIMERAFDKYDIPYFLSNDKSAMYTPLMIYFMNLLEILSNNSFDTDAILRYVKNPINNISFERVSDLENYCYKWNVKGKMWLESFIEDDNVTADNTRQNVIIPLMELKERLKDKTCIEICKEIFEFMESQSIRENIQIIIDSNKLNVLKLKNITVSDTYNNLESNFVAESRKFDSMESVSNEMVRVWDMLMTILDTLCLFIGNDPISIKDFKDVVCSMITQSKFKVAPQKLDAVSFSSSDNARYNSPKVLFILGANDGVFPSTVSNNGIFTNSDMECFLDVGLKFSKSLQDKTADEKLIVYKTLSAPSERLYISYVLKNVMGESMYPSYVVENVVNLFKNLTIQNVSDVPIYELCSTFKSSYEFFVRNFWNNSEIRTTIEDVLTSNNVYTSKLTYLKDISNNTQLKIQDKKLALKLFKNKIKIYATNFEDFNLCHFKYFCSGGLRIKRPTKADISNLEIGNIIHYCLEKIIKNNDKEVFIKLSKDEIQSQIKTFANEYKQTELGGDYGKNERFEANFNRVKDSIFQTIQHMQQEFAQLDFTPTDFELFVDDNKDCKPLSIKNQDGMEILLCGKIDRVDILHTQDKSYVRIVDYKSGFKDFSTEKLPYGIDMQMFLYLFTITGTDGKYQNYTPAGVLYMPVGEIGIKDKRENMKKNITNSINSHFKMKGVILNDIDIIKAMDKTLNGVYVPFKTKPGKSKNMVLTENQFDQIRKYAEGLIINMANCLSNGDISTKALIFSSDEEKYTICRRCDYWSICGNYPHIDCNLVEKNKALDLYNTIISKEGENDED